MTPFTPPQMDIQGLRQTHLFIQVEHGLKQGMEWEAIAREIGWSAAATQEGYRQQMAEQCVWPTPEIIQTVQLKVGDWCDIMLPSLAHAGYLWENRSRTSEVFSAPYRMMTQEVSTVDNDSIIGATADERFCIQALAPGDVVLSMEQLRPFAPGEAPASTIHLRIKVKAAS